jgi:signal transduction histidine kinase
MPSASAAAVHPDTGCTRRPPGGFLAYRRSGSVNRIDAPAASPPSRALLGVAAGGVSAVAGSIALAATSDHVALPAVQATLVVWIMVTYLVGGLVAWWRRPASGFGRLLVLVGFGVGLSNLAWSNHPLPFTVGQACDVLPVAMFLHVFLAFPTGRLIGMSRVLVGFAYAVATVPQVTVMLLGGFGPDNLLAVADAQRAADLVHGVELLTLSCLLLAGLVLLALRRRAGRPLRRSAAVLVDSFALGLLSLAVLLAIGAVGGAGFPVAQRLTLAVLGLAPVAFLAALLDARLARVAVGDLVLQLRAAAGDLRPALARALRDPSVSLLYWLPRYQSWVDQEGAPATLPTGPARGVRVIERDGEPVAAIVHHPALADEPELLGAVAAAVAIVLDNGRLRAELRASLAEVRGSRARVLEAGRRERRRLERDLHDGAQQRLVGLSLRLGVLEARLAADPAARDAVAEAKREVTASLEELRTIARGLYPAVLAGHGLAVALESVATQAAVPVRLDVRATGRQPEAVEVAAYYVVCESLTNADRHAGATGVTVAVDLVGDALVVEVADDGAGGADPTAGTGLRGLADRVEAVGGTLRVWSPAGGGTRVRAELPCG